MCRDKNLSLNRKICQSVRWIWFEEQTLRWGRFDVSEYAENNLKINVCGILEVSAYKNIIPSVKYNNLLIMLVNTIGLESGEYVLDWSLWLPSIGVGTGLAKDNSFLKYI